MATGDGAAGQRFSEDPSTPVVGTGGGFGSGQFRRIESMLNPGDRMGPYEVEKVLGVGTMTVVYLARHTTADKAVALKVPLVALARDSRFVQSLGMECGMLSALDHPCIARILGTGVTPDGRHYIVQEYVDGAPLSTAISRGILTYGDYMTVIRQVREGLNFLHGRGVLHLDVKPSNILLSRNGRAKVADFGLVRCLWAAVGGTGYGLATAAPESAEAARVSYMAPELRPGPPPAGAVPDTRADIHALAVTYHHMFSGALPAEGRSRVHALNHAVPGSVDGVLNEAMAPDRGDRFDSVQKFTVELLGALMGQAAFFEIAAEDPATHVSGTGDTHFGADGSSDIDDLRTLGKVPDESTPVAMIVTPSAAGGAAGTPGRPDAGDHTPMAELVGLAAARPAQLPATHSAPAAAPPSPAPRHPTPRAVAVPATPMVPIAAGPPYLAIAGIAIASATVASLVIAFMLRGGAPAPAVAMAPATRATPGLPVLRGADPAQPAAQPAVVQAASSPVGPAAVGPATVGLAAVEPLTGWIDSTAPEAAAALDARRPVIVYFRNPTESAWRGFEKETLAAAAVRGSAPGVLRVVEDISAGPGPVARRVGGGLGKTPTLVVIDTQGQVGSQFDGTATPDQVAFTLGLVAP